MKGGPERPRSGRSTTKRPGFDNNGLDKLRAAESDPERPKAGRKRLRAAKSGPKRPKPGRMSTKRPGSEIHGGPA